jgi:hypothetical protein
MRQIKEAGVGCVRVTMRLKLPALSSTSSTTTSTTGATAAAAVSFGGGTSDSFDFLDVDFPFYNRGDIVDGEYASLLACECV